MSRTAISLYAIVSPPFGLILYTLDRTSVFAFTRVAGNGPHSP
jgi:hypothetical protein